MALGMWLCLHLSYLDFSELFEEAGADFDFSGSVQVGRGALVKQVLELCPLRPQRLQVFCLVAFPVIGVTFSAATSRFA
jgi:hypothetical protein